MDIEVVTMWQLNVVNLQSYWDVNSKYFVEQRGRTFNES